MTQTAIERENAEPGSNRWQFWLFGDTPAGGLLRLPLGGIGDGDLLDWEIHFVRWLERSGYDVGYTTDLDTHERGAHLIEHKRSSRSAMTRSRPMYDAVESARDAGVHLGFFGANAAYWQVRFAPSASGVADRVMICFKDATLDPVQEPTTTVNWRDPLLAHPSSA